MRGEIHCRDQHEHDQHEFDGGRIEIADAGVVCGKAAQPHRGESMTDRIEPGHAGQFQRHYAGQRDTRIDQPQAARGFSDARGECRLFHRTRRFGLEQLAPANAEQRQHRHREHDNTHAPNPVKFMPPQIDRRRQTVQSGEHRRAGGGNAGHGLEIRMGKRQAIDHQQQRESRHCGHRRPHRHHQQISVTNGKFALVAACQDPHQQTCAGCPQHGQQEILQRVIVVDKRGHDRQYVTAAEHHQHQSQCIKYSERAPHQKKPRLTWNSFSTFFTIFLSTTKTITWSSASITIS